MGNIVSTVVTATKSAAAVAKRASVKYRPFIFLGVGIAGIIVGTVEACKETKSYEEQIRPEEEALEEIRAKKEAAEDPNVTDYTIDDYNRDITHGYIRKFKKIVVIFHKSVFIMCCSIACIISSVFTLWGALSKACAAATGILASYDNYRSNIIETYGEDADRNARFGIKNEIRNEIAVDKNGDPKLDENGEPKTVRKKRQSMAFKNDCRSFLWDEVTAFDKFDTSYDPIVRHEANLSHILITQRVMNDILASRKGKPLFLNEVLDALGLKQVPEGQLLGWRYLPDDPNHIGDNRVDFGLTDVDGNLREKVRFLSGSEEAVLLTMNYDGLVWEYV